MRPNLNRVGFAVASIALCAALALTAPAHAQAQSATPTVTRTVLAETKLHISGKAPLYFGAVGVVVPTNESSDLSIMADGILYEMSGSTEVTAAGTAKHLDAREALFIPVGKRAVLKAGNATPSTLMFFLLGPAAAIDRSEATGPATVIEIFRTPKPIPNLKAGVYDLNLTAISFPPHTPMNAPHHRSGAALYYVLLGTGANTVGSETVQRGVGSVVYEPYSLVHQWGNPGDDPLRLVVFNMNREGVSAVVPSGPIWAR